MIVDLLHLFKENEFIDIYSLTTNYTLQQQKKKKQGIFLQNQKHHCVAMASSQKEICLISLMKNMKLKHLCYGRC